MRAISTEYHPLRSLYNERQSTALSKSSSLPTEVPLAERLPAKRCNKNIRKRIESLFIKSNELRRDYGIEVAVFQKKNNQYYTYRSMDRPTWQPSMAEVSI